MTQGNGYYKEIQEIRSDVKDIKDDLSHSIDKLSEAVNALCIRVDSAIQVAQNVIPIKAVMWMFGILVITMLGVEGVQVFAKLYLK